MKNIMKFLNLKMNFRIRKIIGKSSRGASDKNDIPILSGEHAFLTLENHLGEEQLSGMKLVASRKSAIPLHKDYYKKNAPMMSFYVDEDVLLNKTKIRLAGDGYLRLGYMQSLRQKGRPLVIFGGDAADNYLNVEVLVFQRGRLIEVTEQKLPLPSSEIDYDERVDSLLSQIEQDYPDCVMEQCLNLPRWDRPQIKQYHSDAIFKRLPIIDLNPSDSVFKSVALPVCLGIVSAAFYAITVFSGFTEQQSLTREARQLEQQMFQLTDERSSIQIMEAREAFKSQEGGLESDFIDDIKLVAGAIASIEDVEIQHIRAPGSSDIAAFLSIAVPAGEGPSPLIQARGILDEIVQRTEGYSLRLSRTQSITERGDNIIFYIEVLNG